MQASAPQNLPPTNQFQPADNINSSEPDDLPF
jgi:hypothetical protein